MMKTQMFKMFFAGVTLFSLTAPLTQAKVALYQVDKGSSQVGFEIIKFKIGDKVPGTFKDYEAKVNYDAETKEVKEITAEIKASSIFTDNEKRDNHLKSEDFFDVEKYPTLSFKSDKAVQLKKEFELPGTLQMRGVSKPVTLKVKVLEETPDKLVCEATTNINRLDYGLTWNKALEQGQWKKVFGILGKSVLDDKVDIKLKIVAQKK